MKYKFKLPIGDWSDDGHGKCDYYFIESNVELKDVIFAYKEACNKWNIDEIASEFEENTVDKDIIEFLEKEGFKKETFIDNEWKDNYYVSSIGLAQLIIDAVMKINPSIVLKIVDDSVPMMCNWSAMDLCNITIDLPGYGCFNL